MRLFHSKTAQFNYEKTDTLSLFSSRWCSCRRLIEHNANDAKTNRTKIVMLIISNEK